MSKKKIVIILAICSLSIFLGYFIIENKEEKLLSDKALFGSSMDSNGKKNIESFENNGKVNSKEKISIEVEENNKLDKSNNSINNVIDENIIIKKVQDYILEGDYEKGFKILKGLIVQSTNSEEEAENTYAILKSALNFGASIAIENIDELEGLLEDILGESIDTNGNVVTLDDKAQIFIDKFKEVVGSREVNEIFNSFKKGNLEDLASEFIDIIREVDISK